MGLRPRKLTIATTLINELETFDGMCGIEPMCVAGGMSMAMLVEPPGLSGAGTYS